MKFGTKYNLSNEERLVTELSQLFEHFGYNKFKMNKFEEYDLYSRNKEFLASDSVITFTDTTGKLMALKPDVTLSIIKNYKPEKGAVKKLYYSENVYRTSKSTKTYRELMQIGLECMGDLDIFNISEVITLAARTLEAVTPSYVLDLSHMGIIKFVLEKLHLSSSDENELLEMIQSKNYHGMQKLLSEAEVDSRLITFTIDILRNNGELSSTISNLKSIINESGISITDEIRSAVNELETISVILAAEDIKNVNLDLSVVNDMAYYNNILFKGYIEGVPSGVLSGGQYGELMAKMGKRAKAIGFALYLDQIEEFLHETKEYDIDVLILYDKFIAGDRQELLGLYRKISEFVKDGLNVQAQKAVPDKLTYREIYRYEKGGLTKIEKDN